MIFENEHYPPCVWFTLEILVNSGYQLTVDSSEERFSVTFFLLNFSMVIKLKTQLLLQAHVLSSYGDGLTYKRLIRSLDRKVISKRKAKKICMYPRFIKESVAQDKNSSIQMNTGKLSQALVCLW